MRVVFVHGACVKDGVWGWPPPAELLAVRGVASAAPGLPSCGAAAGKMPATSSMRPARWTSCLPTGSSSQSFSG